MEEQTRECQATSIDKRDNEDDWQDPGHANQDAQGREQDFGNDGAEPALGEAPRYQKEGSVIPEEKFAKIERDLEVQKQQWRERDNERIKKFFAAKLKEEDQQRDIERKRAARVGHIVP